MLFQTYSQIGTHHTDHNEDAFVVADITDSQVLLAVMDGCSMGTESHFASALVAKLLRRIAKQTGLRAFAERKAFSAGELLKQTIETLFQDLARLQADLDLDEKELLTTLILAIVDTRGAEAEIIAIGDGVINVDGQITEIDQDNKPDYLGYHLREDFAGWWAGQRRRYSAKDFLNLTLATDGVLTFRAFSHDSYRPVQEADLLRYLLDERMDEESENMIRKQILYIENTFGLRPTDDLTLVRVMI
ncbi:protein phosphatase 2C domain-containing protein [Neolewinella agarilytica]|uniref:Protein phosphatase 2C n=2 Tax=Neolewinella agarilytica TaxID=478744 RepID=A0A1H9LPD5_9BACT|nr:protein phosphatase 2C domain-containing protein [Neolewinella agarilytica]SER13351.1 Protein phosphatase 2C [Neolewinella agarilytica]